MCDSFVPTGSSKNELRFAYPRVRFKPPPKHRFLLISDLRDGHAHGGASSSEDRASVSGVVAIAEAR